MSGALDVLMNAGPGGGGGYGGTLGPMAWSNIFDQGAGFTDNQTVSGITGTVSIGATLTGTGAMGPPFPGTKSFSNGDVIAFEVINFGTVTVSGTVTVTNQTKGGTTIDTFTYTVERST